MTTPETPERLPSAIEVVQGTMNHLRGGMSAHVAMMREVRDGRTPWGDKPLTIEQRFILDQALEALASFRVASDKMFEQE